MFAVLTMPPTASVAGQAPTVTVYVAELLVGKLLVTVTMNVPAGAAHPTVKLPGMAPAFTAHVGFEMRPGTEEVMVQLVSPTGKPVPVTVTIVPGGPEVGVSVINGAAKTDETPANATGTMRNSIEIVFKSANDSKT